MLSHFLAKNLIINPVYQYVKSAEMVFRVDQRYPGIRQTTVTERCNTDLADTRQIRVGSFNVDNHEIHARVSPLN
jgi:hypothetical protein